MNLLIRKNIIVDKILLLLYSMCILFVTSTTMNRVTLYVLIPVMTVITLMRNYKVFFTNKYIYLYLFLLLWMFITTISAEDVTHSLRQMIRMVSSYVISVISFYIASRNRNYIWLYILMIIYFILLLGSAYGSDGLVIAQDVNDREQFDNINANAFGYFLFYMSFAVIMLISIYKEGQVLFGIIAAILLIILSVYIALITASRQVLLIQIPFILLILFLIYFKSNSKNTILFIALFVIMLLYGLPIFNEYYSNSFLAERTETSITEDSRFFLIRKGLEEGVKHPILGLGPNNFVLKYDAYTHCSYTELFACSGIFALFLYLAIIYHFLKKNIYFYRKTKDKVIMLFIIFGVIFSFYNFFYVFVGNLWLMAFFYIILGHNENYIKNNINKLGCY